MISNIGHRLKGLLILTAAFLICGCTTVNREVGGMLNLDTDLKLEILADSDLNPDEGNNPSPVFVRLYELKSTAAFEGADFIDLYEDDAKVLGDSMVAKQELKRVIPNTLRNETFVLSDETKFVALFAEFYQFENAKAKVVFPVTESNVVRNVIGVKLSENIIKLVDIKHRTKSNKRKSNTYTVEKN